MKSVSPTNVISLLKNPLLQIKDYGSTRTNGPKNQPAQNVRIDGNNVTEKRNPSITMNPLKALNPMKMDQEEKIQLNAVKIRNAKKTPQRRKKEEQGEDLQLTATLGLIKNERMPYITLQVHDYVKLAHVDT